MHRLIFCIQFILLFVFVYSVAAGRSPEGGVIGLKDWTKDEDLRHPYGVGFYLFQPVSGKVKLTFEFDYFTSETRGSVYDYYGYSEGNTVQLVNSNRLSGLELGFRYLISSSRTTFLEFGGGLCFLSIGAKRRIYRSGELWASQDNLRIGLAVDIGLLVAESKDLPLTMRFGFRHRFLSGLAEMHIPESNHLFNKAITTTEVSWGFGYQFGR